MKMTNDEKNRLETTLLMLACNYHNELDTATDKEAEEINHLINCIAKLNMDIQKRF